MQSQFAPCLLVEFFSPTGEAIVRVKIYLIIFSILIFPIKNSFSLPLKSPQIANNNFPDSLNVRLIGRWANGPCLAVDVVGSIVYFGNGSQLEIADCSNPAQPTEIGKIMLPSTVLGVKVNGNYAYVANDAAGLRIIDVSNPSFPSEVACYDTSGQATGLDINGTYVYLADGERGLRIIDISNPFQPQEIGFYDTNGLASKVAVNGNFVYVTAVSGGLRVIDVSNPFQPNEVGSYTTSSNIMDVAVSGNFAYVAAQLAGLRVLDVSNPSSPLEIGNLSNYEYAYGIAVQGTYAYLVDGQIGLRVIDVSNPYQPGEAGYYNTDGIPQDVTLSGNYAFVADSHNGLRVIDISNPYQPTEIGYFNTDGISRGVTIDRKFAYLVTWEAGLRILDILNPSQPVTVGSLNLSGRAEDVAISGNYAYLTNYENGLHIIDITDSSQPVEVGFITENVYPKRVAVRGNYAYVADPSAGLRIIDVSNPSQPILIAAYDFPDSRADAIVLKDNYAYLAAGKDGLRIMDISNPTQPFQVGAYNTGSTAISIDIDDNYAYIGSLQSDFSIIDITNPAQPIEAGSMMMSSPLYEIIAGARYIYVANGESGLQIIDVFNPSNPVVAGYYITASTSYGVIIDENYIYVTDKNTGLYILEFLPASLNKAPLAPVLTSPVNNSFINKTIPQLTWQISVDENGDPLHFKVEVDQDSSWSDIDYVVESKNDVNGFLPIPPVSQGSGSISYTIQSPLSERTWCWRVSAWDGLAFSNYSESWCFTIDATPPVLNNLIFENPGFGENWFNPTTDSTASVIVYYDELNPQFGCLFCELLADTLINSNLMGGFGQQTKFEIPIVNQFNEVNGVVVQINDRAGNYGSIESQLRLDGYPPFVYNSNAPDTVKVGQIYDVQILNAKDGQSGVANIYLDVFTNPAGIPTTSRNTLSGINIPGIYYYRYYAEDYLGNRGQIKTDTTVVVYQAPIYITTDTNEVKAGEDFWIDIHVGTADEPVYNLLGVAFELNYSNSQYVDVDSIMTGDFFGNDIIFLTHLDDENGKVSVGISREKENGGVDGNGTIVRIKYTSGSNTPHRTPVHFTFPAVTANDTGGIFIDLIPQDTSIWIVQSHYDFTMEIEPDTQVITQGDSADFNISFEKVGDFNSQISLDIAGLPDGMAAIYPLDPFDIPTYFTITFTTSNDITPGFYRPIIVNATGGGLTHSDTVAIQVISGVSPDFSMTATPDTQSIYPGESTQFSLSFQPIGGFDAQIILQIPDLPDGMDVTFPSGYFLIPASFDITFTTTNEMLPGVYQPVITATGAGIIHQVKVTIKVLERPDFIMTIIPDSQRVKPGESVEFQISLEPVGDFVSQVAVEVSNIPSEMGTIIKPQPVDIPAIFSITFTTSPKIMPDIYYPIITASGGGITHQETIIIKVIPQPVIPNYGVLPNPFTPNGDGFNDYVEFRFPETLSGGAIIQIFDISGRKIREIRNSMSWYGTDDGGKDMKPGAYIYIVKIGEKIVSKGVVSLAR